MQSLLGTDLDWAHLLQMATRHNVAPLLYRKLCPRLQADTPEHVLNRLRKLYFANLIRNTLLTRELLRLSKLLEEAGIARIPFKGSVLASAVHGDVGRRTFDDLDIMVHREHMAQAKRLLSNEGYRLLFPVHAKQQTFFLRFHFEHTFQRKDGKVMLDIHWAPFPLYHCLATDGEQLWRRTRKVVLEGQQIRTFDSEDLFLILCEHGCRHRWERLSWIVDVAGRMSVDPSLNLLEIVERSKKIGSRRMVSLALYLAADLLQSTLPDEILELINRDHQIKSLASEVYRQLFCGTELVAEGLGPDLNTFYLRTMLCRKDQIMFFVAAFFIPTSLELNHSSLPAAFFFLYVLSRPIRLAAKYASILLKRLA